MPKRKSEIKAKKLSRKEIPCALELVRSVFLEFDAKDYSKEGVQEFMNTLDNNGFVESLKFYGAFEGKEMVGVLAMREKQHISLFFVKADHHKKGIGRKLFEYMKNDYAIREFTVNSAPYAAEVYLRLGFVDTAAEQITNNIRYIPMKYTEENRKADIESLVNLLEDKNNTVACGAMNCLSETAQNSDAVYKYMDKFIKMLSSSNSYVRNRGLKLISVNAKWDTDFKIDEIIDEYLKHITDIKPITARQCISFLPEMVKHKKDLKEDILSALSSADVTKYPDSMQGLVLKDIKKAIREIESCE
ncbi:MAG: GNAT family N-acetyltransferase [Clostridia bacterium]